MGWITLDDFLLADWKKNHRPKADVTLAPVVKNIRHMRHRRGHDARGHRVGLRRRLGMESILLEMDTATDLPKIADALAQAHFIDKEINNILADNWLRFLENSLPPGTSRVILK